jgi:hypothetical protein
MGRVRIYLWYHHTGNQYSEVGYWILREILNLESWYLSWIPKKYINFRPCYTGCIKKTEQIWNCSQFCVTAISIQFFIYIASLHGYLIIRLLPRIPQQVSPTVPWFQRFIFPPPFAMKIIKINLWNQGTPTALVLIIQCIHLFNRHVFNWAVVIYRFSDTMFDTLSVLTYIKLNLHIAKILKFSSV